MWLIIIGTKGRDLPSIASLNQKHVSCSLKWYYSTFTKHRIYSTLQSAQVVPSFVANPEPPLPVLSSACWGQGHWQTSQWRPLSEIILVSLSEGGENGQSLCAAMPCLGCTSPSVLSTSSWPVTELLTQQKATTLQGCPKSIGIKYNRDCSHPDPHSSQSSRVELLIPQGFVAAHLPWFLLIEASAAAFQGVISWELMRDIPVFHLRSNPWSF